MRKYSNLCNELIAEKAGVGGTHVPGGVWGGVPRVQSFVNYFNDFAVFFGYGFLVILSSPQMRKN